MLKAELIGNLGADCEVKEANGSKFVTMRIAHSEKFKQANGQEVETTTWVFVRGYLSTRVYSSKKDRQMKAGVSIAATEIELCGGSSELVPRQLIDPSDNKIYEVTKWYWIDADTKSMKKDDLRLLIDKAGNEYGMNKGGFVLPRPEENQENPEEQAQS